MGQRRAAFAYSALSLPGEGGPSGGQGLRQFPGGNADVQTRAITQLDNAVAEHAARVTPTEVTQHYDVECS